MPWKSIKDPYKIWLSEIILQQTRVEQGVAYYRTFIEQFPTIQTLAEAKDEVVYKLWEGLGYYSRCKNLLYTARAIVSERKGLFPDKYEEILLLKGVGPYTAAAISSFAYSLPQAVVDGNVFRVLARYFNISEPIDTPCGRKTFSSLAQELLAKKDPGGYNQAIMDFGATVCKPKLPLCNQCILNTDCVAYKNGTVTMLPVKNKRLVRKQRWFYYFIISVNKQVLVNKRKEKDIWLNLHEFVLYETGKKCRWNKDKIKVWLQEQLGISTYSFTGISAEYKQQLTHQVISGQFLYIDLPVIPESLRHLKQLDKHEIASLTFPKFINQHLYS